MNNATIETLNAPNREARSSRTLIWGLESDTQFRMAQSDALTREITLFEEEYGEPTGRAKKGSTRPLFVLLSLVIGSTLGYLLWGGYLKF